MVPSGCAADSMTRVAVQAIRCQRPWHPPRRGRWRRHRARPRRRARSQGGPLPRPPLLGHGIVRLAFASRNTRWRLAKPPALHEPVDGEGADLGRGPVAERVARAVRCRGLLGHTLGHGIVRLAFASRNARWRLAKPPALHESVDGEGRYPSAYRPTTSAAIVMRRVP